MEIRGGHWDYYGSEGVHDDSLWTNEVQWWSTEFSGAQWEYVGFFGRGVGLSASQWGPVSEAFTPDKIILI